MPQLDYLARQDHYLELIFKGVCIRPATEKTEDIQTRSATLLMWIPMKVKIEQLERRSLKKSGLQRDSNP